MPRSCVSVPTQPGRLDSTRLLYRRINEQERMLKASSERVQLRGKKSSVPAGINRGYSDTEVIGDRYFYPPATLREVRWSTRKNHVNQGHGVCAQLKF